MKIKLTKFAKSDRAIFPTPDKKDYKDGQENEGVSLPIDYWIIGELQREIKEGSCIKVIREERNGIKMLGIFTSSPVVKIEGDTIETSNSVYKIEYLDKEPVKVEEIITPAITSIPVVIVEPKKDIE